MKQTIENPDARPCYVLRTLPDKCEAGSRKIGQWSGSEERGNAVPPNIGTEVNVTMNRLGPGTVTGYIVREGFLAIVVNLSAPPEWYTKQNKGNPPAVIYGCEVKAKGIA